MNTYVIEIEKINDPDFEPDISEVKSPNFDKAYGYAIDKVITKYDENFVSSGNGLISGNFRLSVYQNLTHKHKPI